MPIDKRLWMTFPIDFWMHPKIRPLSDSALRCFVEINGYSRMNDLDGRVPAAAAETNWKKKALAELLSNHPERPSLSLEDGHYVIWNYAEHQETTASRARREETNRANGAKGGRPPKGKPIETESVSPDEPGTKPYESRVRDQSQSSYLTDVTYPPESSPEVSVSGSGFDAALIRLLEEREPDAAEDAKRAGVKDLWSLHGLLEQAIGRPITAAGAMELIHGLLDRSKDTVQNVDGYVATACREKPSSVVQLFDALDIPERVA